MIDELNFKREIFEIHSKTWLQTRLSCEEIEKTACKATVEALYKQIAMDSPDIIFLESPFSWSWRKNLENNLYILAECLLFERSLWFLFEELIINLDRELSRILKEETKSKLLKDLNDKLIMDFWMISAKKMAQKFSWVFIDTLFRKQMEGKDLYTMVREKIISKGLGFYVIDSLKERVKKLFEDSLLSYYWIAYYELIEKYLEYKYEIKDSILLRIFSEIMRSCFLCWPFESLCVVSDRPIEILYTQHKVIFRDGYSV